MTISDILKQAIETGAAHDFRPRGEVFSYYWKETIKSRKGGDIINPYADTGVVYSPDLDAGVNRAAVGVEIGQDEILTIQEWEENSGKRVDLFISHHPRGRLLGSFPHILKTQIGNLSNAGVNMTGMEKYYNRQLKEVQEYTRDINIYRTKNTLELLGRSYISIHSPIDNIGARYVQSKIAESGAQTLEQCELALMKISEYQSFFEDCGIKPVSHVGKASARLGRYLLTEFTGGEEGPPEIYPRIKKAGVSTLIVMHISPDALRAARKARINIVSAGHMSSDAVGMNLFCDALEEKGIEIVPVGGFVRHRRNNPISAK